MGNYGSNISNKIKRDFEPSSQGIIRHKQIEITEKPNGLLDELLRIEQFRYNCKGFEEILHYIQKDELCPYEDLSKFMNSIFIEAKNQLIFDKLLQEYDDLDFYTNTIATYGIINDLYKQFKDTGSKDEELLTEILQMMNYDPTQYFLYPFFMIGEFMKFVFFHIMFLNRLIGDKITQQMMQKAYKHAFILFVEAVKYRLTLIQEIKEEEHDIQARGMGVRQQLYGSFKDNFNGSYYTFNKKQNIFTQNQQFEEFRQEYINKVIKLQGLKFQKVLQVFKLLSKKCGLYYNQDIKQLGIIDENGFIDKLIKDKII